MQICREGFARDTRTCLQQIKSGSKRATLIEVKARYTRTPRTRSLAHERRGSLGSSTSWAPRVGRRPPNREFRGPLAYRARPRRNRTALRDRVGADPTPRHIPSSFVWPSSIPSLFGSVRDLICAILYPITPESNSFEKKFRLLKENDRDSYLICSI